MAASTKHGKAEFEQHATLGAMAYFPFVEKVRYEGADTTNPLAFRYYDAGRLVGAKSMAEHLRFAVAYWHSFGATGTDPFGAATLQYAWQTGADAHTRARKKLDAAFEFMSKLGVDFYCWHDYDLVEEGSSLAQSEERLHELAAYAKAQQHEHGISTLWGTANLFSHPRYMNGASTNPDFQVVAHAAAQVKTALDVTVALGGHNYVFWGGREGYSTLLNTDLKRELDHHAMFLRMARDYGRANGFTGKFLIEPKPMEPTKHQYDYDAATVIGFLREYELQDDFALNIEVNHATLAGHTFEHELQVASRAGLLGSIDANRGDAQNGWDTDQFPNDPRELMLAMRVILEQGGLVSGGINFDAKLRRNSTDPADLFYAHIGGMDAFARALLAAQALLDEGILSAFVQQRYASFDSGDGKAFAAGQLDLASLAQLAGGDIAAISGRQEWAENVVGRYV